MRLSTCFLLLAWVTVILGICLAKYISSDWVWVGTIAVCGSFTYLYGYMQMKEWVLLKLTDFAKEAVTEEIKQQRHKTNGASKGT